MSRNRIRRIAELLKEKVQYLINHAVEKVNDYTIRKKMYVLYVTCVLLPLIITDSVIVSLVVRTDERENRYEMQNIASAVEYSFTSEVEGVAQVAKNIYTNQYVNEFMEWDYQSPLEYFIGYRAFKENFTEGFLSGGDYSISLYADNNGIINGSGFGRIETVQDSKWYRYLQDSGQDEVLYVWYDDDGAPAKSPKRRVSLIRKLNMYKQDEREKILKVDIDYSTMVGNLVNAQYSTGVYICTGDQIVMSNRGSNNRGENFLPFQKMEDVAYSKTLSMYGQELDIYVMKKESAVYRILKNNILILLLLICINAVLPMIFTGILNASFTRRLKELSVAFDQSEGGD